jgi:hypothetical protein
VECSESGNDYGAIENYTQSLALDPKCGRSRMYSSTRLDVASNRLSDGIGKCRLDRSGAGKRCGRGEPWRWIRSGRKAQYMKLLFPVAVAMLLLASVVGCSAEQKELRRIVSPDQKLVAVLMESILNDSAGSVREEIYVNDQGVPLNLEKPVFSAVGCDRVSFDWPNYYTLLIHYEATCVINQFTNRWSRPSDVAAGRPNPIEIVLIRN